MLLFLIFTLVSIKTISAITEEGVTFIVANSAVVTGMTVAGVGVGKGCCLDTNQNHYEERHDGLPQRKR